MLKYLDVNRRVCRARKCSLSLHFDFREQVGGDREQDRGKATEHRKIGYGAEHKAPAERSAQTVDAIAQRIESHRKPYWAGQARHREQRAREKKRGSTRKLVIS